MNLKVSTKKLSPQANSCRQKFLRFFPKGFKDEKYYNWERGYKWEAHQEWQNLLSAQVCRSFLKKNNFEEIANRAVRIESKTNLLFSFEKMAIRDAIKIPEGAKLFALGLVNYLYSKKKFELSFNEWYNTVSLLPRKQTRVLTWPIVTVFGFISQPERHIFLKPNVTRKAALEYGFDFHYQSKPSIQTYNSLLEFAQLLQQDLEDLAPQDMIDIQSFIWVLGSSEFDE
jgi:hypothetical protein